MKKKPRTKKVVMQVDPTRGAARLAASLEPPLGYHFLRMVREGTRVEVTYVLEEKK